MKRKVVSIVLLIVMVLGITATPAYATPPSSPHVGSGTYSEGGYYFQYLSSSGWKDLRTPPHYIKETGEVAYCIDHKADSPAGNESYGAFNPSSVYSSQVYNGLLAIIKNGYPYQTGGLSAKQARYATANAIRAWLSESAGIGYNFMKLSRGYVRAKSGYESIFNWMVSLVNKARNNSQPSFGINTSPSNIKLKSSGNQLVGQLTVNFVNINGYYTIDNSKIPSGVSISGYTGANGDRLTISASSLYAGKSININQILTAHDTRATANMYWFSSSSGAQPVVVPVIDSKKPVVNASIKFYSDALGTIEVYKKDATTNANLSGAVFQILNSSNQQVDRLTTNSKGYDKSIGLPSGTYSLKEITAPDGYLLDTSIHGNVKVNPNATTTVNFTNVQPTGKIRIQKTNVNISMGNYSLEGTVFEIRNSSNILVDTVAINNKGQAISENLPLGNYRVTEKTAPYGYVRNTNTYNASLAYAGQTISVVYDDVTVPEQPQVGRVRVHKTNANPSMGDYSLAGAEFEVRNSNNTLVDTITTDSTGLAISNGLLLGEYTVTEKTAPTGYVLNTNSFTANLEYGGQTVSVVYDDITVPEQPQTGTIQITKADSETGTRPQGDATLDGAVYEIRDKNGGLMQRLESTGSSITSDELPLGTYTVKEVESPIGYLLSSTEYTVAIEYSNQKASMNRLTQTVIDDVIKGNISIAKFAEVPLAGQPNSNPKSPLAGVEFEIRLASNNQLYDTLVTNADGLATSIDLPYGEYTVTEIKTPTGYRPCEPFNVIVDQHGKTYSYIIENKVYKSDVKIIKVDQTTGNTIPLAGTQFKVMDSQGNWVKQNQSYPTPTILDIFETSDDGTLVMPEPLIFGEYILREVKAPYGYTLGDTSVDFSIIDDGATLVTVEYLNAPVMGTITVKKTGDVFSGADNSNSEYDKIHPPIYSAGNLKDAMFEIIASEDIITPDGTLRHAKDDVADTITTNADGLATSKELFLGSYVAREIQAPYGYVLDKTEYSTTLEYENQNVEIVTEQIGIHNQRQTAQISLIKQREAIDWNTLEYDDTSAGVGFTFGLVANENLCDIDGNIIIAKDSLLAISETDENGEIVFGIELPYASYYVKELDAPDIYQLDDTEYEFGLVYTNMNESIIKVAINDGEPIQNKLIKKQIQMNKVDKRDDERPLAGAVFEVHNAYGQMIETLTTDENGKAITSWLPVEEYTFTEVKAPVGFILEKNEYILRITDDETTIYTITAENMPTEVTLTKTDIADDTPLTNARIEIYNSDDVLVFDGDSNADGELIIQELPYGTYTFVETIAPAGYTLNTSVFEFTIYEDGTIEGATNIQDTPTKVTLSKMDSLYSRPVANAEIEIFNSKSESIFKGKTDDNGEITVTHLPIGTYTFVETTAPSGYILSQESLAFTIDAYGEITGDTIMTNSPTAINIFKVKYQDNTPLTGAGFRVKNWFGLNTLSFTQNEDSTYRYDTDGDIKDILVDGNGQAIVYGLPLGNYWLEETIVPTGYYPAAPVKITVDETHDIETPCEIIVPNSEFVKLGLDRDKYNVPIAIGITLLTLARLVFFFIRRKRKVKS